ncbi:hypothetical protein EV138_2995 [Kribbella voronezhensis]|uniref:Uncharacterized protein n=1 Tax=Kribbella voronezhensis TaxID=2512212 RepID=A0A4R7TCI4_9ACTN|nr:hypothetical protein [Kribbella voronezhensis]TDU89429.1 hypothetical protein EV138_2995 [Kribbella voronezhensis]
MSVHDLIRQLPDIATVRRVSRALAVLDLVLCEDPQSRYYVFDARWSETEEAALMNNGSGDAYSIVFSPDGVYARGFEHESSMSPYRNEFGHTWPGMFDGLPAEFHQAMDEPAFADEDGRRLVTTCFWRRTDDAEWSCGPVKNVSDDGAEDLFDLVMDSRPEAYLTFAEDYYERALDLEAVRYVYALMPLSEYVVTSLNPERRLADLTEEIAEIGYPRS